MELRRNPYHLMYHIFSSCIHITNFAIVHAHNTLIFKKIVTIILIIHLVCLSQM